MPAQTCIIGPRAPRAARGGWRSALLLAATLWLVGCTVETVTCDPSKAAGEPGACIATICGAGTEAVDGKCVAKDTAGGDNDTSAGDATAGTDAGSSDAGSSDASQPDAAKADATGQDASAADTGACVPACEGKTCGDDGCGGSCGACSGDKAFCVAGQCSATCTPACAGAQCGDDGCGGSCGACEGGGTCSTTGRCVPKGWTCGATSWDGDGVCDCGCGVSDPDCAVPGLTVKGCKAGEQCKADTCVAGPPSGWTCPAEAFDDGKICDCDCGAVDPDCAKGDLPVPNCPTSVCAPDGTCGPCKPSCAGKECGPDGCGGICGVCLKDPTKTICDQGKCAAGCTPKCGDHTCGPDGCGGSCGACKSGQHCALGQCQALAKDLSCVGHCGKAAVGGCGCDSTCVIGTTCCKDFVAACGCVPKCSGKTCGDDGCGGSCGSCKSGQACDVSGACVNDPCKPDPCGGKGACLQGACTCLSGFDGAKCGSCAAGFIGFPDCKPDLCAKQTCSGKGACDPKSGACTCTKGFTGQSCQTCTDPKKAFPDCDKPLPPCAGQTCSNQGACDTTTGKCECNAGFGGDSCQTCTSSAQKWPQCGEGKCTLTCKGKGGCVTFNTCLCQPGFAGNLCEKCEDPTKTWPSCGGAVNVNYAPDPSVASVNCGFCGQPLSKLSTTPDAADKTAPILKVLIPPAGATIAPGMPIVAIIDDLLDPKTVTPSTFQVHPAGSDKVTVNGSIMAQVTTNKNTVLVFFPSNLNVGGNYKIKLNGIKDLGGNALTAVDSPFVLGAGGTGSFGSAGSFEAGLSGCFIAGDGGVLGVTDNISPTDGKAMLGLTTRDAAYLGSAGALSGQASVAFCGPIPVPAGSKELLFDYDFASSEFDEYVGDKYDDVAIAAVSSSKGGVGGVLTSVNLIGKAAGVLTKAFGLPDQGDAVAKKSGWKTGAVKGIAALGSSVFLTFVVSDVADTAFSSALAVDNVRFK